MTPDQIAQAKYMRLEGGMSAEEIALEFGVTKNEVIGALYRTKTPSGPRFKPHPLSIQPTIKEYWFLGGCRWVIGDVRDGNWRWCGAPVGNDESWCADHLAKGTLPGAAMPWRKLLKGIRR